MEIIGTIKKIFDTETFESGFSKRQFILLTQEQYPQTIALELLGNKVDIIDAFKEGDFANVGINLRGREWVNPQGETKFFNSIIAWRITKQETGNNTPLAEQPPKAPQPNNDNPFSDDDEDDDLPF